MKILIADDHALVREGLAQTLRESLEPVDIAEVQDFPAVISQLEQSPGIDLLLLDLQMPGGDGLTVVEEVCDRFPDKAVVVISASEDPAVIRTALDRGASGFIPKSSARALVVQAIRLVMAGGIYLPTQIMTTVPESQAPPSGAAAGHGVIGLTERQREVLTLLRRGLSNKEIARDLGLSPNTVKIHVKAVLRALNVSNRTQAATATELPTDP